jgi:hypothetical protein
MSWLQVNLGYLIWEPVSPWAMPQWTIPRQRLQPLLKIAPRYHCIASRRACLFVAGDRACVRFPVSVAGLSHVLRVAQASRYWMTESES